MDLMKLYVSSLEERLFSTYAYTPCMITLPDFLFIG